MSIIYRHCLKQTGSTISYNHTVSAYTVCPYRLPLPPAPTACSYRLLLPPAPTACSYRLPLPPAPTACPYRLPLPPAPTACPYHLPLPPSPTACTYFTLNSYHTLTPNSNYYHHFRSPDIYWYFYLYRTRKKSILQSISLSTIDGHLFL